MPFNEPPQIERQQAQRSAAEEAILERVRAAARQSQDSAQDSAELEKLRAEMRAQVGPRDTYHDEGGILSSWLGPSYGGL